MTESVAEVGGKKFEGFTQKLMDKFIDDCVDVVILEGNNCSFTWLVSSLRDKGWRNLSADFINITFYRILELAGFTITKIYSKKRPNFLKERRISI